MKILPQVHPNVPPNSAHPSLPSPPGKPSPSLLKRNIRKKKNRFSPLSLGSGLQISPSAAERGERGEREGCENQAASLPTLPVSLSPSVKAEEERTGRRSRRAAARARKAAHSDR